MTEPAAAAEPETPANGEREPDPATTGRATAAVAEPVQASPEVVEMVQEPVADKALALRNEAVERVADAALAMPGVPGRDEFLSLAMQARILSMSGAAPLGVRNNPYVAFHVAMVGRDLGISPSAALELIDVVGYDKSKPGGGDKIQLSLSPQLLNGQIRRLGLGSIVPGYRDNHRAVAIVLAPGGMVDPRCRRTIPEHHEDCQCHGVLGESEFSWEDAQGAGLAGPDCKPGEHTANCKNWTRGQSCAQGYKTYPKRMHWWRASGYAADDYFPEAGLGLYTAEELGAIVDAEGRPIDPSTVDLPDGYEPEVRPPSPADAVLADEDPERHAEFQRRLDAIKAVPAAHQALRDAWLAAEAVPLPRARRRDAAKINALIRSTEDRIRKGEWGDDGTLAWEARTAELEPKDETPGDDAPEGGTEPQPDPETPEGGDGAEQDPPAAEPEADREDPVVALQREAEESAPARRARAEQIAKEAGLQLGLDGVTAPEPAPEDQQDHAALAQAIVAEVKALEPEEVTRLLVENILDSTGELVDQQRRLAEHLYAERGGK